MEQLLSSMAVMMNMNSSSNDLQRAFEKISSKGIPKGKFKGKKFRNFNNKIWICKSFNGHPTIILKSKKTNKDTLGQYYSHIEIMHNKNSLLGSDEKEISKYIKRVFSDEKLFSRLSFNGYQTFIEKFDSKLVVKKILKEIQNFRN